MDPKARPAPGTRSEWAVGRAGQATHQQVHSAAHAVVFALVRHHRPVVQQLLQQASNQAHEVLHRLGDGWVLGSTRHQAVGTERTEGSELKARGERACWEARGWGCSGVGGAQAR